jgi:hypothetical protein
MGVTGYTIFRVAITPLHQKHRFFRPIEWALLYSMSANFTSVCIASKTMTTTRHSSLTPLLYAVVCLPLTHAFSADPSLNLLDRFRCTCPADPSSIRRFGASIQEDTPDSTWAAVYRSNNNKPSILIKDEFFHAMRAATGETISLGSSIQVSKDLETPLQQETPVAIARLHPSPEYPGTWVLDKIQSCLKKEDANEECDGGSEHAEALSVAVDALLLHHLQHNSCFEQAIRGKGTLVSGVLLEERGFQQVEKLCRDMATHVSSLDACMERYADRVVSTKHLGARSVALQILSELGRLNREVDLHASRQRQEMNGEKDDENDPWAGMKQFT